LFTVKRIAIAGSTGSIGTQALDIIGSHPELFQATVLAAGSNVDLLISQAKKYRPNLAVIACQELLPRLREALSPLGVATAAGAEALAEAVSRDDVDTVLTATVGYSGLEPTLRAIEAGKEIALANKETLIVAGELVMRRAQANATRIYPVDSEHSAIYQCLLGERREDIERLIITASGGPFLRMDTDSLARVTPADALRHPNWSMGAKITIDSATMLNKAFEIIEAHWLFGIEASRIVPVVHPQSIVHSMVEFRDGAVKAQLGVPDMHLPISYAFSAPVRIPGTERKLTLADLSVLTFEEPDIRRFPCLTLARTSLERGGNTACVVNAANEIANKAFRDGKIAFPDIYRVITDTLGRASFVASPAYDDYVASNGEARRMASETVDRIALLKN